MIIRDYLGWEIMELQKNFEIIHLLDD